MITRRRPAHLRHELHAGGGAFVTLLAAAVLVLLPALAWLQYSWLDQIADADRERRERTLRTAAAQLAQAFESELAKASVGLQLEGSMVEQQAWSGYAARYQAWTESAIAPDIVKAIYFAEGPELTRDGKQDVTPLRIWKPDARVFELTEWPAELESVKLRFSSDNRRIEIQAGPRGGGRERGGPRFERFLVPPITVGNEQLMVAPVMLFPPRPQSGDANAPPAPPDVKLLGFTIIRLDLAALGRDVLPALVRRHLFDDRGHSEYQVAVVRREDPSRVIYESEPGAAPAALAQPDASTTLLSARMGPMFFMGERRDGPPPRKGPDARPDDRVVVNVFESRGRGATLDSRVGSTNDGNWRLVAKHRAGSLEAAVTAARTRNFALSSGILALLAAAIGLIVVSARRADRLARQQLEFVAAVSHELRTPVSVIGAAAGNLADGVVDEAGRVKQYGTTIQTEARRLAETVERVLQLAGIAAGRASAARVPIGPSNLVEEAVAASRHEIESAGATVEVEIAPELLSAPNDPAGAMHIQGDVAALRSAVQNLISNAIKYGGEPRWVRVSARPAGHARRVRITVEDRGIGISAEDRAHVFEPFFRGREAVDRQIQGSGLGLHLVRRIAEAHGGTVSVQSEAGRGSTFTIELPTIHTVVILRDRMKVPHPQTP